MKYIVFDISTQARRQKAKECALLLYRLQTPSWDESYQTKFANPIYWSGSWDNTDPENPIFTPDLKWGAIAFDENQEIPLRSGDAATNPNGGGYRNIKAWVEFRFPKDTPYEIDEVQELWVRNWVINNNTATTEQLMLENGGTPVNLPALPNWVKIRTQAQFDTLEWDRVK